MDKFNDFYAEPNYTRLFLLFFCFLAAMVFWVNSTYDSVSANDMHVQSSCTLNDTCGEDLLGR